MRKVEFGAGIAAAVLSLAALGMLLFAPLVPYCGVRVRAFAACPDVGYTSLTHAGLDAAAWAFLVGMLLLTLAGAAGAIGEARFGVRMGAYAVWAGAALVLGGCALTAGGVGLLYLPSVLALCLAAYASAAQWMRARPRRVRPTATEVTDARDARGASDAPGVSTASPQVDPRAGG